MAETGKSKTCVWRWLERFMHESVNGLLRDRSRPPGKAPIPPERVAEIVRLTQQAPPHEATPKTLHLESRPRSNHRRTKLEGSKRWNQSTSLHQYILGHL